MQDFWHQYNMALTYRTGETTIFITSGNRLSLCVENHLDLFVAFIRF